MRTETLGIIKDCRGRMGRSLRAYLAAIMCTAAVIAVTLSANAPSASANTSHNYRGISYGFNSDYGSVYSYYWASASYATMAGVGAPEVAKLACGAAFDEPWAGTACYYAADVFVQGWIATHSQDRYHGLLINWYPDLKPHFRCVHIAWTGSQWVHTTQCQI